MNADRQEFNTREFFFEGSLPLSEDGLLQERAYTVNPGPGERRPGEVTAQLLVREANGQPFVYQASGTLTVTEIDGDVIRGDMRLRGVLSLDTTPVTYVEPIAVEGEFVAMIRSQ